MDTLAILNPHAGAVDDLSRVAALIRHHPALADPDVRITGDRDDARLMARAGVKHGFQRILSGGGDGTLNEVVNGLMSVGEDGRRGVELGVLPLGTGNDFARSIGVPSGLEEALDALDSLVPRALDVVKVSGGIERHFINVSAGGFSGEIDEEVTTERKRSWGPLAYLRGALELLPDPRSYSLELSLDGGQVLAVEALNVAVANGRHAAAGVPIAPNARLDDGLVDVVVVLPADLARLAALAPRSLLGRHLDDDLVEHHRARSVAVRSNPEMPFNVDGELVGETPVEYRVVDGALSVLVSADAPALGPAGSDRSSET